MNAIIILVSFILSISIAFAATDDNQCSGLFQVSTFAALLSENYDGDFSIRQLQKEGRDGIGVFNAVDGDMIAVDGVFYRIEADGKIKAAQPIEKTPFAQVACLDDGEKFSMKSIDGYASLKKKLDQKIKNKNIPHAIRIDGSFDLVKLSSSKEQHRPYKPIDLTYEKQIHYQIENTEGTIIGFWFPHFLGNVGVPGYHFHMINQERSMGGHLLDIKADQVKVTFQPMHDLTIKFPHNKVYGDAIVKDLIKLP